MSEIPDPSPEEMGADPDNNETDVAREKESPTDTELLREALEDVVDADGIILGVSQPVEKMPGFRLNPTETGGSTLYTELGVGREKQLAIERFVQDQCVDFGSYTIGSYPFCEGLVCTDIDKKVGIVIDRRLENDRDSKTDRKTQVVLTLRYPGGKTKEVKSAKPVYAQMKKLQIPEVFTSLVETEIDNQNFKIGQYVHVGGIKDFVGQVALLLDQNKYPGMVGVMLVGTISTDRTPRIFAVPTHSLLPR